MDFFYSNKIIGDIIELSEGESRHCIKVLRHKKGDEVMAGGGDSNLYRCMVVDDMLSCAKLKIIGSIPCTRGHDYYLKIAVAPTKNIDRFEWFMEKATEMGINAITPILCDHSERKIFKRERGERLIISAMKQSLKSTIPALDELTPFDDFINKCREFDGEKFIAFCDEDVFGNDRFLDKRVNLSEAVKMSAKSSGRESCRAVCAIGPEGDFSLKEVCLALDNGFIPLSLGASRLRTETAALLCVAAFYLKNSK